MTAWRAEAGGVRLAVRLTPRGGSDRIDGLVAAADGAQALAVRVRAVPEAGQANRALLALLAAQLAIPAAAVTLVSGATSRRKLVHLRGDPPALMARLSALCG